jgi:hypothetical protein
MMMCAMVDIFLAASLLMHSFNVVVNGLILPSLPFTRTKTRTDNFSIRKKSTIHAEVSPESGVVTQAKIMTVPRDAPQSFMYTEDKIYIRNCYHMYYDIIMDRLFGKFEKNFISVTANSKVIMYAALNFYVELVF